MRYLVLGTVLGTVLGWLTFQGAAIGLVLHEHVLMAALAEVAALSTAGLLWLLGASHPTTNGRKTGE